MNDEDFEDWSHPTPVMMKIPRHRRRINWGFAFFWITVLALVLVFWYGVYQIGVAYRVVNQ